MNEISKKEEVIHYSSKTITKNECNIEMDMIREQTLVQSADRSVKLQEKDSSQRMNTR